MNWNNPHGFIALQVRGRKKSIVYFSDKVLRYQIVVDPLKTLELVINDWLSLKISRHTLDASACVVAAVRPSASAPLSTEELSHNKTAIATEKENVGWTYDMMGKCKFSYTFFTHIGQHGFELFITSYGDSVTHLIFI